MTEKNITSIDAETTGLSKDKDQVIEFAGYMFRGDKSAVHVFRMNPTVPITKEAFEVHGITEEDLQNEPRFSQVATAIWGCSIGLIIS